MKRTYLAVFDYGMGGLWAHVAATSPDEITRVYPELTVFEEPPNWMSEAQRAEIEARGIVDLERPGDSTLLREVLEARAREADN
jgi:hypothetical protein